ncbi:uncharacterized protein K452DRAFT_361296 [Aplosporella prunicola CBS 121167]|uniref:Uncharacterized protein n=1 Tax=Aplosporella prunicola CBS 121167 TaxID=1176127 RepID=A0A6A6B312_9PEZI|nr:uncharacterized protein K452DRAFT_361296 [Aplosporella prunicola CBS 121167]KAF2138206.1 hypothetical protein K452DRAFT_361296 [Aplosporella prunicola CBS 121167]
METEQDRLSQEISDGDSVDSPGEGGSQQAEAEAESTHSIEFSANFSYLEPIIEGLSEAASLLPKSDPQSSQASASTSPRHSLAGLNAQRSQSPLFRHENEDPNSLGGDSNQHNDALGNPEELFEGSLPPSPPVSPVLNLAIPPTNSENFSEHSGSLRTAKWQPYTLRDDGSSVILFGSRFMPSTFAVVYVQLTSMLLDDVKRTEPFARMAKPGGGRARHTILQAPGAWWNALADGLSRKKNGIRRSGLVLLAAALINIIGFLAVSPLSASLLESKDVTVSNPVTFSRLHFNNTEPLLPEIGRETYLRILGHLLQDIETSVWIMDNYTVLPFWPSDIRDAPLGPSLTPLPQEWQAESLVLGTELECQPMHLVSSYLGSRTVTREYYNDTEDVLLASLILRSGDGRSYGMEAEPSVMTRAAAF